MTEENFADRLSQLAVTLAREDEGLYRTTNELTADARALLTAGDTIVSTTKGGSRALAKAKKVAGVYNARLVQAGQLEGIGFGLKLQSGQHPGGVYRVA